MDIFNDPLVRRSILSIKPLRKFQVNQTTVALWVRGKIPLYSGRIQPKDCMHVMLNYKGMCDRDLSFQFSILCNTVYLTSQCWYFYAVCKIKTFNENIHVSIHILRIFFKDTVEILSTGLLPKRSNDQKNSNLGLWKTVYWKLFYLKGIIPL